MSPYEDLTEFALADDGDKVKKAIQALIISNSRQTATLPSHVTGHLDGNIEKMAIALEHGDYATIALYAVNSYKTLVDELDAAESITTACVQYLDFVGFDLQTLLKQKEIDWDSIGAVVLEGSRRWNTIINKVSNKALKDTMDTTIAGLLAAAVSRNNEMLVFAAQVDLDLVDLLEVSIEGGK